MKNNREFTKSQQRRLRELGALAHERELAHAPAQLEAEFIRWRANELDAFELCELVHRFHDGPARGLHARYEPRNADMTVASAIHRGVLTEEEAGSEILELLGSHLALLREVRER